MLFVAEDQRGKIVGYVMAKIDEEESDVVHGHITSLSVLRSHRKLGIAYQLMTAAHAEMQAVFGAQFCSLHVRVTNRAAFALYKTKLEYEIFDIEKAYYADGEDAYSMNKYFTKQSRPAILPYEQSEAQKAAKQAAQTAAAALAAATLPPNTEGAKAPEEEEELYNGKKVKYYAEDC